MVAWRKERVEAFYEVGIPMKEHRHALYYSGSIDSGSNVNPSLGQKRDQDRMKVKVTNWFASIAHSIKGKSVMPAAARRLAVVIDSPKDASWAKYQDSVECNPAPLPS